MRKALFIIICLLLSLGLFSGCTARQAPGEELLENPGFEQGQGLPDGWKFEQWNANSSYQLRPHNEQRPGEEQESGGERCFSIVNTRQNKSVLYQRVPAVKGAYYRLSGWIRVDSAIYSQRGDYTGAQLAIREYRYVTEQHFTIPNGWQRFELYFYNRDYTALTVELRVGSDSRDSRGAASFDDVSFTRVDKQEVPAAGVLTVDRQQPEGLAANTAWSVAAGVFFAALVVLAVLYFAGVLRGGKKRNAAFWIFVLLGVALVVRLIIAATVTGHKYDMSCFRAWASQLAARGPWNFYILDGDVNKLNAVNDYVPGYMYVLWLIGGIRNLFHLPYDSMANYALTKLPALFADLGCGWLIYRIARRKLDNTGALIAASLFLFNPFVMVNSAAWGQIESVTTLFTLLTLYLVLRKKFYLSGLAFTAGVLFKFQTVFIFPVYGAYLVYQAVRHRQLRTKLPLYLASYLAIFYVACLPFTALQIGNGDVLFPFRLYLNQIGRYNEYTLNTFNLFGIFGLNRTLLSGSAAETAVNYLIIAVISAASVFLLLKSRNKGNLFLMCALLVLGVCMFSFKVHERYPYPGIVLLLLAFVALRDKRLLGIFGGFSLIHYVNTVVILLRDAGDFKNGEPLFVAFSVLSVLLYLYLAYVAMSAAFQRKRRAAFALPEGNVMRMEDQNLPAPEEQQLSAGTTDQTEAEADVPQAQEPSPLNEGGTDTPPLSPREEPEPGGESGTTFTNRPKTVWAKFVRWFNGKRVYKNAPKTPLEIVSEELTAKPAVNRRRMGRKDWILLGVLTAVAAVLAFSYLGGFTVPETAWETDAKGDADYVILQKPTGARVSEIWTYTGVPGGAESSVGVYYGQLNDSNMAHWNNIGSVNVLAENMYKWQRKSLEKQSVNYDYLMLYAASSKLRVLEVVLIDAATGKPMENVSVVGGKNFVREESGAIAQNPYAAILDEGHTFTGGNSLMTDMYFDEIYHARTAFELIQGWNIYEWTHPPLGKELIALGVLMFGMNPVGWRCVSALFSVAIIPVAYLLAKRLLRSTPFAAILAGLFTFDGLRMVMGRIGTLDAISVFFILTSFYFMQRFTEGNFNRDKGIFRQLLWFALSGVAFGFSIAVKWTGVYAGLGLLIMFLFYMLKRGREYVVAKDNPDSPHSALFRGVADNFTRKLLLTLAAGVVFFLLVPFAIYLCSYIPTYRCGFSYETPGAYGFWDHFWENQKQMLGYHSGLQSTHASSSKWYMWLADVKGVYFYLADSGDTYAHIHAFGTPVLYWMSLISLVYFILYVILRPIAVRMGLADGKDKLYRSNLRILGVLFIGLLSNLLPWVFVTRTTYFYHILPSTWFYYGFTVLLLRQMYYDGNRRLFDLKYPVFRLEDRRLRAGSGTLAVTGGMLFIFVVLLLVFVNFWMFYPVFSGVPVPRGVANGLFRWVWVFGRHYGI